MRALQDRLIVRPDKQEYEGAIALLERDRSDLDGVPVLSGEVVSVGSGKRLKNGTIRPLAVSIGERVMFTNHDDMHVNGEDFMVIREADVLGVLDAG